MIKNYIGIFILSLIVIGAIIYGFSSSGSPAHVRALKFDTQRISDINSLKYNIDDYYRTNGYLPATLENARPAYNRTSAITDPETKKSYEYIPGSSNDYKLCAVFSVSNLNDATKQKANYTYYSNDFKHPKGYYCFSLSAPQPSPTPIPYVYPAPITYPTSAPTVPIYTPSPNQQ